MFEPQNEQGVIVFFAQQIDFEISAAYPDAIIKHGDTLYKVEFEYQSSNFLLHKHDPEACDLLICWIHDWEECPLSVFELSNPVWKHTEIKPISIEALVNYWKQRALKAEKHSEKIMEKARETIELNQAEDYACPKCERSFTTLQAHSRFCSKSKL
jgi:hypothetical protein